MPTHLDGSEITFPFGYDGYDWWRLMLQITFPIWWVFYQIYWKLKGAE